MKRYFAFLIIVLLLCSAGCSKKEDPVLPEVEQIRSICELATLKCYYNNVAKTTLSSDHFWEKSRELWLEYEGFATIGFDMKQVSFVLDGKKITVKMPEATVLSIGINTDSLNEDSYIVSKDGLIFKNPVTAEKQQEAIKQAQDEMTSMVKSNGALFLRAEQEAKRLIENYINKLGELSNTSFEIVWEKIPGAQ